MNKKTTLDNLTIGKEAYIEAINCEDKALRQHILNMGLTPEVEVKLVKTAPMGDPLELRVRGYELTLRKDDAAKIVIKDIHDADSCPKKTKEFIDGILPKEMPIDKKINYVSQADSFQRIKDSIQVSIDKMTRG